MDVSSCIQKTLDGHILIDIEVQPESKRSGITGFNDWRNRLSVSVSAQAKDGKANQKIEMGDIPDGWWSKWSPNGGCA